jgi:hypothetical protein
LGRRALLPVDDRLSQGVVQRAVGHHATGDECGNDRVQVVPFGIHELSVSLRSAWFTPARDPVRPLWPGVTESLRLIYCNAAIFL